MLLVLLRMISFRVMRVDHVWLRPGPTVFSVSQW